MKFWRDLHDFFKHCSILGCFLFKCFVEKFSNAIEEIKQTAIAVFIKVVPSIGDSCLYTRFYFVMLITFYCI